MIELVVFDMAGAAVYDGDAVNTSFRAALSASGVEADPVVVNTVMGLPKPEAVRQLLAAAGRPVVETEVATVHDEFVRRMRHYYATDPAVREISGAAAPFAALLLS